MRGGDVPGGRTPCSGAAAIAGACRRMFVAVGVVLAAFSCVAAEPAGPRIFWASSPVKPDETVVVAGEGLGSDATVELRLAGDTAEPSAWQALPRYQPDDRSVKAVLPPGEEMHVYACRVRSGEGVSNERLLNAPEPWWWLGDLGEAASPGGWLRIFGKTLNCGAASRVRLTPRVGDPVEFEAESLDGYGLSVSIPADLAAGSYGLLVGNGLPEAAAWQPGPDVVVRPAVAWKRDVFNVRDFPGGPGEALLAALKKAEANEGGVVFLPRGRYPVSGQLSIPPRTILRGEAMELVSLFWPDYEKPPHDLVIGRDFGLESLTLYCQNHWNVVADTHESERLFMHRVRIRANGHFMIEDVGKPFRGRSGPASHRDCNAAVMLYGRNFSITECDLYASNFGVRLLGAKSGVVASNRILFGGLGYSIESGDRVIVEGNTVTGANPVAACNTVTTFWSNACTHLYVARNRHQHTYGADREMITLDAGGGAYFGPLAAASGTRVTLGAAPAFRDYAPTPHTDWRGAIVQILSGRGAGQYRFVKAHEDREWTVTTPWDVEPDTSSVVGVVPFRGRNLFIENSFLDGGMVQLYGAAHDTIVAGNRGARIDGFLVWGLSPHGWLQHPSWGCQFFDNEIVEGNGFGNRSAIMGTNGVEETDTYDGPMVQQAIFRRNVLHNNARIFIGGRSRDVLVEHCRIRGTEIGVEVGPEAQSVLLRGNVFEDVATSVQDPSGRAVVVAAGEPN